MRGVRALRPFLSASGLCLLLAACAGSPAFVEDGWGVQRRFDGQAPSLLSISEINAGTPPAVGGLVAVPVRSRQRGRYRVALAAERGIAAAWTPGAALFDPELDRALDWLARLGAAEPRAVELRLTLVPDHGARRHRAAHAAGDTLVVDLLVPVASAPRSRGAAVEAALATGLHEAAHALRGPGGGDRDDDEYRSALVAACFRIDGLQRGDRLALAAPDAAGERDFTRAHSASAGLRVRRELAAALGREALDGGDRAGIATLRADCARRLSLRRR